MTTWVKAGLTLVAAATLTWPQSALACGEAQPAPKSVQTTYEECMQFNHDYVMARIEADSCNFRRPNEPCTVPVQTNLLCPCTTFVNPENRKAMEAMELAEFGWGAGACSMYIECGAALCPYVVGASCEQPSPSSDHPRPPNGVCVDHFH